MLSQWDFSHGKFGLLSTGKASCDRVALPNMLYMLGVSVSIVHRTLTWTTGSLTCAPMLMYAIAHGSLQTRIKESVLKVDWEKNPLLHQGIEPASVAWRSDALSVSYILILRGPFLLVTVFE